jgi:hypothetical protein
VPNLANIKRVWLKTEREKYRKMKAHWSAVFCALFIFVCLGMSDLQAQESAAQPSVLHIVQTKTTSPSTKGVPTFLATYHVLDGAKSPANLLALKGTLSLKNHSANFSQVLWVLVYWQGECPAHDIGLKKIAGYLWLDITKNPSQSDSKFPVDLRFPKPIAATGCIGFYYGGGPVFEGKTTMTADLELTYQPATSNPNTVVSAGGGEYCFGQNWGCQNATTEDEFGFAVPTMMQTSGHLLELYGNISDSTFDGTNNFGPLPTGKKWGAVNDWYLLRGSCGEFGENINFQGFPNPLPLSLLYSWLPPDALHLESVSPEYKIPEGGTGEAALQKRVQRIFSDPVQVNAGDCLVTFYGRRGNGATDNETQVNALMGP